MTDGDKGAFERRTLGWSGRAFIAVKRQEYCAAETAGDLLVLSLCLGGDAVG